MPQKELELIKSMIPCSMSTSYKEGTLAPNLKNCFFILINSVLTGKAKY